MPPPIASLAAGDVRRGLDAYWIALVALAVAVVALRASASVQARLTAAGVVQGQQYRT